MIVRVLTASGGSLGETSSREELLDLLQRNTPPGYIPEVSSPDGAHPIDIDGPLFEGCGSCEIAVNYVPSEQYLRRLQPEVLDYVDRVVRGVQKAVLTLRSGRALADTAFVPLLDGMSWIDRASGLATALAVQLANAPVTSFDDAVSSREDALTPALEKLHRAVSEDDPLEVADILDAEITDWLEARRSQWSSIAGGPL